MQVDWLGPVVGGVFGAAVVLFLVLVLRKARQRRREAFSEAPVESSAGEGAEAPRSPPAAVEVSDAETEEALPEPERTEHRDVSPIPEPHETEAPAAGEVGAPAELKKEVPEAVAPEEPLVPDVVESVETEPPTISDPILEEGLARTRDSFFGRLGKIFGRKEKVDRAVLDDLEELLLTADVGVGLTTRLLDDLRGELDSGTIGSAADVQGSLRRRLEEVFAKVGEYPDPLAAGPSSPQVILFVGVNGVGKTTTIGKIAAQLKHRGQRGVLAAADTFRAAAVEQLQVWGERTDCRVIRGETGADPASVVFNAIEHARSNQLDFVLADTAGRLHTKTNLMDEIKKVKRAMGKARPGAPDEVWLVVDATTGQNALQQAREFHQTLQLTGVVLTKLDGTAKGGVVIAIVDTLGLPVKFVGVGEKSEDLRPFAPSAFIRALVGEPSAAGVA